MDLIDHGHSLPGFLPAGSAEMKIEAEDAGLHKSVPRYRFTSSKTLPLETVKSHTLSSSNRKEQVSALSRPMLSFCDPLRKCTETGLNVTLERKLWTGFPRAVSYCRHIPDGKNKSSIRHGAGRSHSRGRWTTSVENMMHGRKRPNLLLAATAATQRKVRCLKGIAGLVSELGQKWGVIRNWSK